MPEQLSMDFMDGPATSPESEKKIEPVQYEPLDMQLANLFEEENGEVNETLKNAVLALSKHTREGQIFIPCSGPFQEELLKTNIVGKAGDYKPLIVDNNFLYLNRYFSYQERLANQIRLRLQTSLDHNAIEDILSDRLDHFFHEDSVEGEVNYQKEAARLALSHSFFVLSGGPGTGKTTTISRILALLVEQFINQGSEKKDKKLRIVLAAPTGKAAIRMLDALLDAQNQLGLDESVVAHMPTEANTLHKLLGYQHNRVEFKHNAQNPLHADVVIVDEASMIDVALMSKLVSAVPSSAKLILIGDKDQLSSVETGSVFTDICTSLKDSKNFVTLQKNWRFSDNSGIGLLAKATNASDSESLLKVLHDEASTECRIVSPTTIENNKIPSDLIDPWTEYFELLNDENAGIGEIFKAFNQFRVLCTLRKGYSGSTIISNRIEDVLVRKNLISSETNLSVNNSWYHGRPIMVTQNSYSKGLFNGDTGIVLRREGELKVYFPDGHNNEFKSLSPVRLPAHETTWAMTIHKSQGSEFDEVALIMPHEVMPLLTKQLIYTGITRAKKRLCILANDDILVAGLNSEMVKATQIESMLGASA